MSYVLFSKARPLETVLVSNDRDGGLRVVSMSLRDAARVVAFSGADVDIVVDNGDAVVELALVTDDIGDVDLVNAADDDHQDVHHDDDIDLGALFADHAAPLPQRLSVAGAGSAPVGAIDIDMDMDMDMDMDVDVDVDVDDRAEVVDVD